MHVGLLVFNMIVLKNYQSREKGLMCHALTGVLPEDVMFLFHGIALLNCIIMEGD